MSASRIRDYLNAWRSTQSLIEESALEQAWRSLSLAWDTGATVFVAGNGGSASTASHFATDIQKSTISPDRPSRLRVISLADNTALLTAWANDFGYDRIFAEPLFNLAKAGDVLVAISASGNSPNIVKAAETARELGLTVVGMTGFTGGRLRELSHISIHIPVDSYELAEDAHSVICHTLTVCLKPNFTPPVL